MATKTKTPPKSATGTAAETAGKVTALPKSPTPAVTDPGVVTEVKSVVSAPALKKRELFQLVADRSGLRKNQVKPAVEAMLDVLGAAIAEGRELNLEPFGKLKHQRSKDTNNARVTVAKIRQNKAAATPGDDTDGPDGAA